MPKFILKINSVDDTVYVDDDIVCFLADSRFLKNGFIGLSAVVVCFCFLGIRRFLCVKRLVPTVWLPS